MTEHVSFAPKTVLVTTGEWVAGEVRYYNDHLQQKWTCHIWKDGVRSFEIESEWRDVPHDSDYRLSNPR